MSAVSWMHCANNRHAEQAIKIPFRGAEASWAFNQVEAPARALARRVQTAMNKVRGI